MAATSPTASKSPTTAHESASQDHLQHHGPNHGSPRGVKRQKVTRACDSCKSRKRRCTGEVPCAACHSSGSRCTYNASYTRGRLVQPQPAAHLENPPVIIPTPTVPIVQDPPVRFASSVPVHGAESTARTSRAASPDPVSTNFAGQYLGPTSSHAFLRRAWKRFEQDGAHLQSVQSAQEETGHSADSIYCFGDRPSPPVKLDGFRLPSKATTLPLLAHYFDFAMPTYRFLHQQTVAQWLESYHQAEDAADIVSPARQAVVLMVLATARLFPANDSNEVNGSDQQTWKESELLFQAANAKLDSETGKPRLESIQARIATCLYLLHTSRPNQAWYRFGTTVQLIFALGLHRATNLPSNQQDHITRECRKRSFWAASTLDTYLSVMLGRPPLINLEDVDQRLPDPVDDEDLTASGVSQDHAPRDSVIRASILHARITRIVKKAAREQYSMERKRSQQKLETAIALNAETADWYSSLPVVLSGAIHPSSLIPVFRRQITVLQLAHGHATMLINRPALLLDSAQATLRESQVNICMSAAKSTLDSIVAACIARHTFQAFWYTQFVSFNALSIIYVWVVQRRHGRLPSLNAPFQEEELLRLAELVQKNLMEASEGNAPSLRYSIVLEELQQEVQRATTKPAQRPPHFSGRLDAPTDDRASYTDTDAAGVGCVLESVEANSTDPFMEAFALDPNIFISLDSFPFADFGLMN